MTSALTRPVADAEVYDALTVVIPTLNEQGNIGELLDELLERYSGIRLIVADDDSVDRTREEVEVRVQADPRVRLLWRRGVPHGLTASVLDALGHVDTEWFAVMDGDLQHPPETLAPMVERLRSGAGLVVAARHRFRVPPHRWLISKVATALGWLRLRLSGSPACADCMSGFFAGRTALVLPIARRAAAQFEPAGYKVLFDLLKQLPRSFPVAEVPYEFDPRQRGQSKISPRIMLVYLRSVFRRRPRG